jgi:arsenate reductase (glutaredoxin)
MSKIVILFGISLLRRKNNMIQILHNPRCGKSRNCLAFLENTKEEIQVVHYLTNVPSYGELQEIITKLAIKPIELVRTKEKIWIENYKNKTLSDQEIIQAMVSNPILIERPIVIKGEKAIIGRETDKIIKLFYSF